MAARDERSTLAMSIILLDLGKVTHQLGKGDFFFLFLLEISIDYPEEVTDCTITWGLQNSRTKCWFDVVSSIARVIWGWYSVWWRVWVICGVVAWVTLGRQICLWVVGVCDEACRLNDSRCESTIGSLCGWHEHSPSPQSVGRLDQMVVRVQGALSLFPNGACLMAPQPSAISGITCTC